MRHSFCFAAGLAAAVLVLAACQHRVPAPVDPPAAGPPGGPGTLVTIGTIDRVSHLDPAAAYDSHSWDTLYAVSAGLLMNDPAGQPTPVLAAAMPESTEDGLRWTVRLKEGLRFPSGRALTAEDVAWSIERVRRLGAEPSWFVNMFIDRVEVVDSLTLHFYLLEPAIFFPQLLTSPPYFPVDKGCFDENRVESDNTAGGLGQFLIREWKRDELLELEANPDWPADPPGAERLRIRYFDGPEAMIQALRRGEIDVAWGPMGPERIAALREEPELVLWEGPTMFKRNLVLTHSIAPFDNPRLRQALAFLVDRQAIVLDVYGRTFTQLFSPIPNGMPGHNDSMPDVDVAKAGELLAGAGYTAANPLVFDLWWTTEHYGEQEAKLAAAIKQQFEASGAVRVRLRSKEWLAFNEAASNCEYPAYLLGWQPDYLDLSTCVDFFALSTAASTLCSNYANPEMDELVLEARRASEWDRRLALYRSIQDLWATDVPTIPLVQGMVIAVSTKEVERVVIDPLGMLHYGSLNKSPKK